MVIGLVKKHLMKVMPPRALWVPFELGRPMGPPGNPEFQQQVLLSALNTITMHNEQPVILDFQPDDPRATADKHWKAPLALQFDSVAAEVQALNTAYETFCKANNRTSVGVAKVDIKDCAIIADQLSAEFPQQSEREDVSPVLMARYAIDDLKSYYIEAALSSGSPSSTQVYDWFWYKSYLGQELLRLRAEWMNTGNSKVKKLGELFVVPHRWR